MLENSKYVVDFCGDENFFVIISQLNQSIENQKEQNIARSNPKLWNFKFPYFFKSLIM